MQVKQVSHDELNFGIIPVSQRVERTLKLRNKHKQPTVYSIRKLGKPTNCVFTPMKGRVPAEDTVEVSVIYQNRENMAKPLK